MASNTVSSLASLIPTTWRVAKEQDFLATNIPSFDVIVQGVPRGAITEIYGPASSGRTTFLHAFLCSATRRGEYCALVDAGDQFDPESSQISGIDLNQLFWV